MPVAGPRSGDTLPQRDPEACPLRGDRRVFLVLPEIEPRPRSDAATGTHGATHGATTSTGAPYVTKSLLRRACRLAFLRARGLAIIGILVVCGTAHATVYVVASAADTGGTCTSTPTNCTLRQAIASVNADTSASKHFINFNLPGGGATISPATAFPAITRAVIIDGYSQSGSSENTSSTGFNAVIKVGLSGANNPGGTGLDLQASATVSGLAISGFSGSGINGQGRAIESGAAATVNIRGCAIGFTGSLSPDGNHFGIRIGSAQSGAVSIGSDSSAKLAHRNLISGNTAGDVIAASGGTGVVSVLNNLIGTNAAGNGHVGTQTNAINIARAGGIVRGNVIKGSDVGILLQDAGFQVTGNTIGYVGGEIDGAASSVGIGIRIVGNASGTGTIGGAGALANRIYRSLTDGIEHSAPNVNVDFGLNQVLMSNETQANRPFDLRGADGLDANDAGDADSGPNGLQNSPVVTSATRYVDANNEPITISGTLNSLANRSYRIDFHQTSVGTIGDTSVTMTTDGSGNGSFGPVQVVFPNANVVQLAATATLLDIGTLAPLATSENSAYFSVQTIAPPVDLTVNSTNDPGTGVCDATECTLREAIVAANANFNPQSIDVIRFNIPGSPDEVHVINISDELPSLDEAVTIDGYSQPGAAPNTDSSGVGSNAQLKIELRGGNFHFSHFVGVGANVTVKGLSITGFDDPATAGGLGFGGLNARVEGCWFGIRPDGTEVLTNMVLGFDSNGGVFGGDAPAQRNVFANRRAMSVSRGRMTNNLVGLLPDGRTSVTINALQPGFSSGSSGALLLGSQNTILVNENVFSTPSGIPAIHGGHAEIIDNAFGESWDGASTFSLGSAAWADIGLHLQSQLHFIRGALDDAFIVDSSNHLGSILLEQPIVGGSGFGVFHSFGSHLSVRSPVSGTAKIGINLDSGGEDQYGVNFNGGPNVGPNDLQDFPELTSALRSTNHITVAGVLNDVANSDFRIVICGTATSHVSGHGGCDVVLDDQIIVTSDMAGTASFEVVVPNEPAANFVTATAARIVTAEVEELTSEYALNIPIEELPIFADGFE